MGLTVSCGHSNINDRWNQLVLLSIKVTLSKFSHPFNLNKLGTRGENFTNWRMSLFPVFSFGTQISKEYIFNANLLLLAYQWVFSFSKKKEKKRLPFWSYWRFCQNFSKQKVRLKINEKSFLAIFFHSQVYLQ